MKYLIMCMFIALSLNAKPTQTDIDLMRASIKQTPLHINKNDEFQGFKLTKDGELIYKYKISIKKASGGMIVGTPTKKQREFLKYTLRAPMIKSFKDTFLPSVFYKRGFKITMEVFWADNNKRFLKYSLQQKEK